MLDGTYAGLQTSVGDFLNRADLAQTIPDFIKLAEAQANRRLRVNDMVTSLTLTLTTVSTPLPADFNGMISFELPSGVGNPLRYEKPDGVRAMRQTNYSSPGTPFVWTIVGTTLEVAPAPSGSFACPMVYYARIPALSATAPANYLLTKHPDIYLYGALLQSAPYLKDDARLQAWGSLYSQAVSDAMAADARVSFGHGMLAPVRSAAAPAGTDPTMPRVIGPPGGGGPLMDYAGLQTAVADFLNRADLYGTIPTFIALTEAQLLRRLTKAGVQGAVARASTTIADEYETVPADYTGYLSHTIWNPSQNKWQPLEGGTQTGIATIKGNGRASTPQIPDRFAVVGNSFWYCPTPDQEYQVNLIYWAAPQPLSSVNPSNWVLAAYPDVYLYGALSQAAPYLGESPALGVWRQYYDTATQEIIEAERRKRGTMFTPSFRAEDVPPNYGRRRWLWDITTGY